VLCSAVEHYFLSSLWELLWLCHVSNTLLGVGMLVQSRAAIWVGAMSICCGTVLWLWEMVELGWNSTCASNMAHVGGTVSALLSIVVTERAIKDRPLEAQAAAEIDSHHYWILGVLYGIVVQFICRVATPVHLNINVAFAPYKILSDLFPPNYYFPHYWLFNVLSNAVGLFLAEVVLTALARLTRIQPSSLSSSRTSQANSLSHSHAT